MGGLIMRNSCSECGGVYHCPICSEPDPFNVDKEKCTENACYYNDCGIAERCDDYIEDVDDTPAEVHPYSKTS